MAFSSLVRLTLSITLILSSFVSDVICFTPPPRFAQTSALIGNKIYYMGGVVSQPDPIISDFFYLDTSAIKSTDSSTLPWTNLTGLDNLFASWGTAVTGGANKNLFVLYGGRMTPAEESSLVIVYDTNNNTWNKPTISGGEPARRRKTQAVIDNGGKMYIFGGSTSLGPGPSDTPVNDMSILDTVNWVWSTGTLENAPDARIDFSATILSNGLIVYIGGSTLNDRYVPMSQINTYDTTSDTWASKDATGQIPNPRGGHSAVLTSDGHIIIYGGAVSISADGQYTAASPDIAVLDTTNNNFVWSQPKASGTAPPQIAYHTASLVGNNNMVIAFGNITNKGPSPNVYVLDIKDNNYKWITSMDNSTSSSNVGAIVGAIIGCIGGLILLGGGLFWFYRRRKTKEGVIETPGEFTDAGFARRYDTMNSATTSQTSYDFSRNLASPSIESEPSKEKEFHPSYSHNFPVQHDPEIEDDDDKEFRILPQELQPEYLEKKFGSNNGDDI